MFFKHIMILFIILGVLGYYYGDRIFYFQAHFMMNIQYDFPAYEAYEKIVRYYPSSPHRAEAIKMMEALRNRNGELRDYINTKDKDIKKLEKERAKREEFR